MKRLFEEMGAIVEKNMEHYKTDFYVHDQNFIQNKNKGDILLWYIWLTGTEIMDYNEIQLKDSNDYFNAKLYLGSAKWIYKITLTEKNETDIYGDIDEITDSGIIKNLIEGAKDSVYQLQEV